MLRWGGGVGNGGWGTRFMVACMCQVVDTFSVCGGEEHFQLQGYDSQDTIFLLLCVRIRGEQQVQADG